MQRLDVSGALDPYMGR